MILDTLAALPEEEQERIIQQAFNRIASTDDGKLVFAVMFEQLYFFRPTMDLEQQALNNYAKKLFEFFGEHGKKRVMEALLKGDVKDVG